ncbi:MAG: MBL fold metallo-hydrolase [Clostridia bacterium]|nr:MBL fold metallo-hydrolase [Clostridia bacterium]
MYELIQVTESAYYLDCPSKIGIVKVGEDEVVLIDSGKDRSAAKKARAVLDGQGWRLRAIYNTHSHADHIGGNKYLIEQTGCPVFAYGIEQDFTRHTILEPSLLFGACPPSALRNKFLLAEESAAQPLTEDSLPKNIKLIELRGHSPDMVGFKTDDGALFIADSLSSAETLEKYGVGYIYDIGKYIETLKLLPSLEAKIYIPSHAAPTENIAPLAELNLGKTLEIIDTIREICDTPSGQDDILKAIMDHFGLTLTTEQYALVGSTLRSYISYLYDIGELRAVIEDNRLLWVRAK